VAPWPIIVLAGAGLGLLVGLFGVGGSSVATPVLSLLGVPAIKAVASPLPAAIPAALLASLPYVRAGEARPRAAAWTLLGGVPATIVGALLSRVVGGPSLLVLSGIVLVIVGLRVVRPIADEDREIGTRRRQNRPLLVLAAAGVGLFTGLLANAGAFLLVPLYLLVFGLRMRQAVGTSLIVAAGLSVPTLVAHTALGHIDWAVAAIFGCGLVPAGVVGARVAHRIEGPGVVRRAFGWFLLGFGVLFTVYRLFGR
jgi:uncharacterized membrane protein YfcA